MKSFKEFLGDETPFEKLHEFCGFSTEEEEGKLPISSVIGFINSCFTFDTHLYLYIDVLQCQKKEYNPILPQNGPLD